MRAGENDAGTRSTIERLFKDAGLPLRIGSELSSNEAIKHMCAAGFGVAFLSMHTCVLEMEAGVLALLPMEHNPIERDWYVISLAGRAMPAAATAEAINLSIEAEKLGADASLQVAPYYNKPSQEGLFQHFREVARNTELPIVLYSIPGRCGIEIAVPTVKRLAADCKNIVGIKEAGGNADRVSALCAALGNKFEILSGDDSLTDAGFVTSSA